MISNRVVIPSVVKESFESIEYVGDLLSFAIGWGYVNKERRAEVLKELGKINFYIKNYSWGYLMFHKNGITYMHLNDGTKAMFAPWIKLDAYGLWRCPLR